MKVGDLVRNKATGDLAVIIDVGKGDVKIWMRLLPVGTNEGMIDRDHVYLSDYYEVISESTAENEDDK